LNETGFKSYFVIAQEGLTNVQPRTIDQSSKSCKYFFYDDFNSLSRTCLFIIKKKEKKRNKKAIKAGVNISSW
jgi:hypothetical protein